MQDGTIKSIFKTLLLIFIFILACKFFIFLLPFILVGLLIYMIYKRVKSTNVNKTNVKVNKKIDILEAEVIREKKG